MTRAAPLPADERRRTIIDATRPLLVAHGAAFTTKQIAEAAGVAEGTIFRVFGSKQELLDAVIEDVLDPTPTIRAIQAFPEDPDLGARVTRTITLLHDNIAGVTALFAALHAMPSPDISPHPHKGKRPMTTRNRALQDAIEVTLTPWADQLRSDLPRAAALLRSVALATYHPMFGDHLHTSPAALADLLLHGLQKDKQCS
ncbi:TetR/AcrR family transcriptional regulator [Propionibacterium sp.]|uniref:TetR/AcrR family transcriptional regulator n=1 Tax=Propionibacterium sp. TaxID=1977903 RepID=UPI0039E95FC6